jgi:TRAP-type C4-dicarboxylate transport system substrate-binding protein
VQKHLVLTKHVYNPQAILISKRIWDRLSPDEHKVLQEAAREARDYQRRVSREQDVTELEALKATMQITEMPEPEIARMREKAKPIVEKYNKTIDPSLIEGLRAELARIRGSN